MPSSDVERYTYSPHYEEDYLGNRSSISVRTQYTRLRKTWSNTAGYWDKKKGKSLGTNFFTFNSTVYDYPKGSFRLFQTLDPSLWTIVDGTMYDSPVGQYANWPMNQTFVFDSSVTDDCSSKLLSEIKGASVNLAQCFAERKQTADLLASTATRLAKSFSLLRKGNVYGACQTLGALPSSKLQKIQRKSKLGLPVSKDRASEAWLELQYGWKPLVQDVHDSAEFLAKSLTNPEIITVTARKSRRQSSVTTSYGGLSDCLVLREERYGYSTTKMSCTFRIDSQASRTLSGAGISNPALLAWELLPYSFVVDWFLPVGNYLENVDSTAGCTFLRGAKSEFFRYTHRSFGTGRQHTGVHGNITYTGAAVGSVMQKNGTRSALSAFPSNPLPKLKNPFSLTHVGNAIALLQRVFRF